MIKLRAPWKLHPTTPQAGILARVGLSILLIALTAFIGYLNYLAGYYVTLSVFYLIPIFLGVIWITFRFGLVMSFVCAMLWVWAEIASGRPIGAPWIPVWNWIVRSVIFSLSPDKSCSKADGPTRGMVLALVISAKTLKLS